MVSCQFSVISNGGAEMQDFKKLVVRQHAHALTLRLYELSGTFPPSEVYGLTSQLRRAASSVPANIAEGCGRNGAADFARFSKSHLVQRVSWSTT